MPINLVQYLDRSAKKFPEKLAISDENLEVTFSELKDMAMRIASYIKTISNKTSKPIAVEVDRCTESLIMFMGVLYSGNFYVPIDNKMPLDRVETILEDVNPLISLSIKSENIFEKLGYKNKDFKSLIKTPINNNELELVKRNLIDIDPAYMMYTSGSTGKPKGVVISHRMVMDFSDFLSKTFNISSNDILANQAPFYFDCSVKCIYQMLRNGSSLYIMRPSYFMFPIKAVEFFNEKRITTLLWATSGLNIISNSGVFKKLKPITLNKVFFSGEMLYAKDYLLWKEACHEDTMFINLYGPTEVTVDCTYYIIEREFEENDIIPIGWPCRNMNVYILDEENKPVKDGEVGEICARGTGISYGYYNSPEKTNEVFIQNPFHNDFRDIVYKTGDIGRYNEYGEIIYISRKDNQVKHMGSRIELGEIEIAATGIGGVEESVVFYDHNNKEIILICNTNLTRKAIINSLKSKLPRYMIPNKLITIDGFPSNRNGKIDRVKLKESYFNNEYSENL